MEFFSNAKTVRLKARGKYLLAGDDGETVKLKRDGSGRRACWGVGFDASKTCIQLKSCHDRYLTASKEEDFHGNEVTQSLGTGDEINWEPFKDGSQVYFKSSAGYYYLRANGGVPPVRNTVSHAVTNKITEKFQWVVEVLEFSHVNLPKVFTASGSADNQMQEMRAISMAYYANCSNDYKEGVCKTFKNADTDGNGSLSLDEFKAACLNLGCVVESDGMFRMIDKDGSGTVDFEEAVTFYYMLMNRRIFCAGDCKKVLLMSYFSCVECYCGKESGSKQFNVCVSCYGNQTFEHGHTSFLDTVTLLNNITPKNEPDAIIQTITAFNKGWTIGTSVGHVATFAAAVGCSIM